MENARFDIANLRRLIRDISSGATPKVDENYYTDSSGVPFLRVQNVKSQGIDLRDAKFIKREVHEGMLKRSQLKKDDLVFTITGRIGSVAVVPDNFEGNINQHSVRFHLKTEIANVNISPRYVAAFLNSSLGQSLAIREVTGGTRPGLDYKALYSLKIILPPPNIQNHIVTIMQSAYAQKKRKEQEANALLDSIDDYVLAELGIEMPVIEEKKCFVVYAGEIQGRVDASAYRALKTSSVNAIQSSQYKSVHLKTAVVFRKEIVRNSSELLYVGLKNIESNTGSYVPSTEEKESFSSALKFETGDVLFPKLGPYLNKVHLAQFNGVCSTEFQVMKGKEILNNLYLLAFLRTKLVVNQTTCLMTGSLLPRLGTQDVERLPIPLPPIDVQDRIAAEVKHRLAKTTELKREANAIVEQAKKRVERILLAEE